MTSGELYDILCRCTATVYEEREAESVSVYIMNEIFGVDRLQLTLERDRDLGDIPRLNRILEEIKSGRPAQYITGTAWFCGIKFAVTDGVLIPRPETEELVEWIVSDAPRCPAILDIGTGSGAIAVSLAAKLHGAHIRASDISLQALETACLNAALARVELDIVYNDITDPDAYGDLVPDGPYDVIVSNPPYIPLSEAESMHINVKSHEPHGALFVPDSQPLVFYRAIYGFASMALKPGGRLYFEVHENYAAQVAGLLASAGFREVTVKKDINGKERMVRAMKL